MRIENKIWRDKKWIDKPCKSNDLPPRNKKEKVSGIYAIICTDLRIAYIGQSINIQSRWSQWRHVLKRKTCEIVEMQKYWDSGYEFVFKVLEETTVDMLIKERNFAQKYVDDGYSLFNSYFLVNPTSMLMNSEDREMIAKLLRLITKGRINRQQFEQYLDNL